MDSVKAGLSDFLVESGWGKALSQWKYPLWCGVIFWGGGHLHLNITLENNSLDYDLAMNVIDFFQLAGTEAENIKEEVLSVVSKWESVAKDIGISRSERQLMAAAFNI